MRKLIKSLLVVSSLTGLVFAGTAVAAGSSISVSLSPNKVKKNSHLTVNASGFPAQSGLPTSAEFLVQPGFKTSPRSVSKLCSPSASSCPSASKIGTGIAQVTASVLGQNIADTVNFRLYLGKPKQGGDIASVEVFGSDTYLHQSANGSGRLFKSSSGGLELLFDQFPTVSGVPSGATITLNTLSFNAGAKRTVTRHHKKVTYSLITNPSTCTGQWTGSGTVTFSSGPVTQTFSTPCSS
jgi:hypothetical protein